MPPTQEQAMQELQRRARGNPALASRLRALGKQKEKEQKRARRGTEGGFLGDIGRAILKPVATLASRPVQLGMALGGATPEEQDISLPFFGDIKSPRRKQDVARDIGRGLETVALGVGTGAVTGTVQAGARGTLGQALKFGVREGAKAGALGGAGAVLSRADEETTALDVGAGLLTGGALGGVTAGILGGVTRGATRAVQKFTPQGKQQKILDFVTPKAKEIKTKDFEKLVAEGRISPKTKTEPAKFILNEVEEATALRNSQFIEKDPVKTAVNLQKRIGQIDSEVGTFLETNNGIYNTGELRNAITQRLEDITDITVDEGRLIKAKQRLIDNFVRDLKKNDMKTLWEARKAYDQQINKAFTGSPSVQKEIKIEFRNAIQDFVAERTPDDFYRGFMGEMTNIYRLRDTVLRRASRERAISGMKQFLDENPGFKWVVGGIGAGMASKFLLPGLPIIE